MKFESYINLWILIIRFKRQFETDHSTKIIVVGSSPRTGKLLSHELLAKFTK